MTTAIIEHVNLTVSDPERTSALLHALFGWSERWRGPSRDDGFTIHVGSGDHYFALYTGPAGMQAGGRWEKGVPLNLVGLVVDDLDAVERQALALGLIPFAHGDYDPGRRFYFFDHYGIEYEIVSYSS
jgi:catechol 2,3-dioxygenase-like lactoylglutathione lyase family enzyme